MMFVNKKTLKVYSEKNLRESLPNVVFPEVITQDHLEGTDFVVVHEPPRPMHLIYQNLVLSQPFINGHGQVAVRWIINTKQLDDSLRKSLIELLRTTFEKYLNNLTEGYPQSEIDSWTKQETEARNYLADNSYPTPFIDALATAREVPKDILVQKIIEKADLFAVEAAKLIGARQKLEDQIMSAINVDQLPEIPHSLNYE